MALPIVNIVLAGVVLFFAITAWNLQLL